MAGSEDSGVDGDLFIEGGDLDRDSGHEPADDRDGFGPSPEGPDKDLSKSGGRKDELIIGIQCCREHFVRACVVSVVGVEETDEYTGVEDDQSHSSRR